MSSAAEQITITYTGSPANQLVLAAAPEFFVLNTSSISGTPLDRNTGKSIGAISYLESTSVLQTKGAGFTTLSFDDVYACSGASINACPLLTSLQFPELVYSAGTWQWNTHPLLTSFGAPKFVAVGGSFIATAVAALTSLSLPRLESVGADFTVNTMANLTTFSFPLLSQIGRTAAIGTMASITSISLPLLTRVGNTTTISTMAALTTISLPALVSLGGDFSATTSLGNVTTVTFGTVGTLLEVAGNITFSGQKLTQASVDQILAVIASLDGTNGTRSWGTGKTLTLSGGTNAAPSTAGSANKDIIVARGATVNVN